MMVDINLLEEKEKKNRTPLFIIIAAMSAALIMFVIFMLSSQQLTKERDLNTERIEQLHQAQEKMQLTMTGEKAEAEDKLQEAHDGIMDSAVPTVPALEKMIGLLPERGYIENYILMDRSVEVQVRFDSFQQAAAYTDALLYDPLFENVELVDILSSETEADLDSFEYRTGYSASYSLNIASKMNNDGEVE
ncbi:hypothetical protein LF817_03815 [Halobacillus sp. A1]|uniref:PilN domain-containing protein n=1 Tax=Halobacillus sp. A1 TaxID=2880262 RepID=UPI0020A622CC|nr:PilN domain-containing protein [Halobacillus sp. A1]MCP3030460.1 hypothetical protein [Halobacillus sp. A1]